MRIFAVQLDIVWEDKQANFDRLEAQLRRAAPPAHSLVVLPEMSFTGFSMNVERIAAGEPAQTEGFLAALAQRLGVCFICGLVTQTPNGRGRNQAIFVTPQGCATSCYQKLHLFSPAGENSHFEPGSRLVTALWQGGVVAPLICYDLRFPEPFRAAVLLGAELFVVIANWPRARERHWLTLLQARAIENQAFVVGVNRCGRDPNVDYSGRSIMVAPDGEILADAGESEGVINSELHWEAVREYRQRFRVLQDRRTMPVISGDARTLVSPRT